ncbi:MAG: FAD-binding oxidoreductase, partial [Bacteroidales bacterium]
MNHNICKPDPDLYTPVMVKIDEIRDLTSDVRFFKTVLTDESNRQVLNYEPGQFMMLSVYATGEAPFSITSTPSRPGSIEFGIRKVGKVTDKIFAMQQGDTFGLRGPFGNGFPIEKMKGKDVIIVAGGLGSVPLRSLLLYIMDNRDQFGRLIYLYGARNHSE